MAIGTLYVSNTPKLAQTEFHSIPFNSAKIEYKHDVADAFSFRSNRSLQQGTRVRYNDPRGKRYGFGGQIYQVKKSVNGLFEYDCVSYVRLYMSKITSVSYSNITSYNLIRRLILEDKNNLSLAGLTKTPNRHAYLKWENKSIWEIARNLQYLEWKAGNPIECYVDIDGILHFGKNINVENGYKFTTSGNGTNTIIDYEETLTTDDIITVGRVIFNGSTRATAKATREMIATWGYIEGDSFDCTETVTQSSSTNTVPSTNKDGQAFINKYNIDSKIVKQANSIIGSTTSETGKAKAIWQYMRDKIDYVYYPCTKRGALRTLNERKGNCADQTHLYMSLAGSVGLRVRCNHIKGHFFPETALNNKWFITDTVTKNGWGNHWGNGAHLAYYSDPNNFNC